MKRSVSIIVNAGSRAEPPSIGVLPATVVFRASPARSLPVPKEAAFKWLIPEDAWSWLRSLRTRLRDEFGEAAITEWWSPLLQDGDLERASLVALALPSSLNRPIAGDEPVVKRPCASCGRHTFALEAQPKLRVQVGRQRPALLGLGRHGLLAVSKALRQALEEQGLLHGVDLVPVETEDAAADEEYRLAIPTVRKPVPAAPYGWAEAPCAECGRGIGKCSFFPVFERIDPEADWLAGSASELLTPLVSRRLFATLRSFAETGSAPAKLLGMVYGWRDADAPLAYLPEEFQGFEG